MSSLKVDTPLAIGTMQWGTTRLDKLLNRGFVEDEDVDDIIRIATANGVRLFDTAEGYGGGTSEERIRNAQYRSGDDLGLIVATKFMPLIWRFTKTSFRRSLEGSMVRLGVDCIELYFIHSPVHPVKLELWIEAACDAVDDGLIRCIGVSNFNAQQVLRAVQVAERRGYKIAANQIMFNLLDYNAPAVQDVERVCKENDIVIIGFAPIGQGLLVENLTKARMSQIRATRMMSLKYDEIQALRGGISDIATKREKSMAQVCLNWSICKGVIPLIGCKKISHIQDACGALGWSLSKGEMQKLDSLALNRSTLAKPSWRRGIFVVLISALIFAYRVEQWWYH